MKSDKMIRFLKKENFVVPCYLFQLRNELTDSLDEFIILCYFISNGSKFVFNPEKIVNDLNYSLEDVMCFVDSLNSKGLINLNVIKDEKGIRQEYVELDTLYEKISQLLINEINNDDEDVSDIYSKIEESFGRPISSIEYEIIKSWFENGFNEELVSEALKEAVFNGVSNLRYIDTILYEWSKKGIKTVEDVEKNRLKHRDEKNSNNKLDLFDYDWFEDGQN